MHNKIESLFPWGLWLWVLPSHKKYQKRCQNVNPFDPDDPKDHPEDPCCGPWVRSLFRWWLTPNKSSAAGVGVNDRFNLQLTSDSVSIQWSRWIIQTESKASTNPVPIWNRSGSSWTWFICEHHWISMLPLGFVHFSIPSSVSKGRFLGGLFNSLPSKFGFFMIQFEDSRFSTFKQQVQPPGSFLCPLQGGQRFGKAGNDCFQHCTLCSLLGNCASWFLKGWRNFNVPMWFLIQRFAKQHVWIVVCSNSVTLEPRSYFEDVMNYSFWNGVMFLWTCCFQAKEHSTETRVATCLSSHHSMV